MLRLGDTPVPLISMCNGIHLLNFRGYLKGLPVYMKIGNESSYIGQMHSSQIVVIVILQPLPITNRNIRQNWRNEKQQTTRMVLNKQLRQVLHHVTFKLIPSTDSDYSNVVCTDGNLRHFKPVLAACLADCPESCDLHHLERHVCFWCQCPKHKLGDYVPSDKQVPRRDHTLYRMLSDVNTNAADA
jgi:hypothetical protein